MRYREITGFLILWCIFVKPGWGAPGEPSREYALRFIRVADSVLAPVYAPLAGQITLVFDLKEKEGIGIDVGGGPGNLVIELCKNTNRLQWINADINHHFFPHFLQSAGEAGFKDRVKAVPADVHDLPFENDYADVIVSRGSFPFWKDKQKAFSEIFRVLKPGGAAFVGRGFPGNLPVESAREIRRRQGRKSGGPAYEVEETADELRNIMRNLQITDYRIHTPRPPGSAGINYGIWIEFYKSESQKSNSSEYRTDSSADPESKEKVYVSDSLEVVGIPLRDIVREPMKESSGLEPATTVVQRTDIVAQGAKTLIEALEYVPGGWVETRGRKVKQFFSIRGQKYPYPEYSLDGSWQREFHELPYFFTASDIERIEVIRSSAALLNGLSGLVGIINIIPRKYKEPETSSEIEYGTYNSYRVHLSHGASREKVSYAFSLQPRHTAGPGGRNAAESMMNFRGSVRWRPSENFSIRSNLFYLDGKRELSQAEPPAGSRFQNSLERFDPFRTTLVNLNSQYRPNEAISTKITAFFANRDHNFVSATNTPHTTTREYDYEWGVNAIQSVKLSPHNVLRFGGLYNHWIAPNGKRFFTGKRNDLETFSAVVVDEHRFGTVILDAGLRWIKTRLNEYGAFNINGSPSGLRNVAPVVDEWEPSILNGSFGAAYYLSRNLSFHINAAAGAIQPRRGTLDINLIEPEKERRIKLDVGIQPKHERIGQLSIVGFMMDQKDAIVLSGQTETLNERIMELYLNRDQRQFGLEIEGRTKTLFNTVRIFMNVLAMDSQAKVNGDMVRNKELPQFIFGGGIQAAMSNLDCNLFWKGISWYESTRFVGGSPPTPQPLGEYTTLNGTIGWSFGSKLRTRLYCEVWNLTDKNFSTVVGYPDFGRRFTVGVRQTFK